MNRVNLYAKDSKGNLRVWSIWHTDIHPNRINMEYGTHMGNMIYDYEVVDFGLAGRTQQEQIESRINSRINKKIDSGYVYDIEEAINSKRTNKLGLEKPMLASRFDKIKDFNYDANLVQHKYDGHRCLIKNDNGELIAYSRNGKPINSIDHILKELYGRIPEGLTIDGELYVHNTPLQTISSWVKKKQESTKLLKFYCYDLISDQCYKERYNQIKLIMEGDIVNSLAVPTTFLLGEFDVAVLLRSSRRLGYEGLILRRVGAPYESGKRSKALIKVKEWIDDEFIVEGVTYGRDGNGILMLSLNGEKFTATAPGNHTEKKDVVTNKEKYIGKSVNIQYACLTKDGVPFQPVATMWRDVSDE